VEEAGLGVTESGFLSRKQWFGFNWRLIVMNMDGHQEGEGNGGM
jgi:hypothetical protein